jgi:hypothetical protein
VSQASVNPVGTRSSGFVAQAWAGPALVAIALALVTLWVTVFVQTPLTDMPLYFAQRYFVLDATSMLFLLVINSVFLGISVYMSSRGSVSRGSISRATLSLALMVAMNLALPALFEHVADADLPRHHVPDPFGPSERSGAEPGARRNGPWHCPARGQLAAPEPGANAVRPGQQTRPRAAV